MKPSLLVQAFAVALAFTLFICGRTQAADTLMVYCAAGLKKPVEAIAAKYRDETKVEVQLQYGGTGTLLSQIRVAQRGDLFITADGAGVSDARKFDSIREVLPLLRQHPVIAVRAGNPKGIRGLADLTRDGVKLALANPEAAAIGRTVRATLGAQYETLAARATVQKPTVTEIAGDLSLGAVDAAILWDSTVPQFKGIEAVEVPEFADIVEDASAAVLTACQNSAEALRFARYLAAPEKGGAIFQEHSFKPVGGDAWSAKPEMILYSGGVNRPAVEKLLREFSDREGVQVTTVFNGCGILCASMKAMGSTSNPKFPDAYYACDLCFVPPVAAQFPEVQNLTETEIGIVVKKGNPRGIKTIADLAQPGLRLGLCNAQQSTLGYMTAGMLRDAKLAEAVQKNVVVEVPTADFLVNQMRVGALEAAIVYRVNAALQGEHLDFLKIDHPGAKAVQPFSIRADTPHRQLVTRLLAFMKNNRAAFESAGFSWRGDEPAQPSAKIEVPPWLRAEGIGPNGTTK
jgi:ABC-type molybdate transport system substrate-binding protein